ncbi:MAG: hypothetical protein DWQ04_10470 [Chloroflexi bacterium]|nr:MAG: hypothetical protein DWQ04_10470 [Chloroflexota bacterium]
MIACLRKANRLLESQFMWLRFGKKKIALFHIGRSGSTVLGDLLHQHPEVHWDGEVFEELFRSLNISSVTSNYHELPSDPMQPVHERMKNASSNYYGFETKFFHLKLLNINLENYVQRLSDMGFRHFIVLERRNYLRKIVSSLVAHEVKQYHLQDLSKVKLHQVHLDVNQIRIDRDEKPLQSFLRTYENNFQTLNRILESKQALHLTYEEDILLDPQLGYRRVCDFLNIEHKEAQINFVRTNPFKLSTLITNFADVEHALRGTPFEWMLTD